MHIPHPLSLSNAPVHPDQLGLVMKERDGNNPSHLFFTSRRRQDEFVSHLICAAVSGELEESSGSEVNVDCHRSIAFFFFFFSFSPLPFRVCT